MTCKQAKKKSTAGAAVAMESPRRQRCDGGTEAAKIDAGRRGRAGRTGRALREDDGGICADVRHSARGRAGRNAEVLWLCGAMGGGSLVGVAIAAAGVLECGLRWRRKARWRGRRPSQACWSAWAAELAGTGARRTHRERKCRADQARQSSGRDRPSLPWPRGLQSVGEARRRTFKEQRAPGCLGSTAGAGVLGGNSGSRCA